MKARILTFILALAATATAQELRRPQDGDHHLLIL
ncbi:MAG: hypothetical protein ACI8XO_002955, partial [Verrucomicrobiales bacterium]